MARAYMHLRGEEPSLLYGPLCLLFYNTTRGPFGCPRKVYGKVKVE